MVVVVGTMAKGIINVNYKVIVEVFVEVYFKMIIKKSATFVKSQIAS